MNTEAVLKLIMCPTKTLISTMVTCKFRQVSSKTINHPSTIHFIISLTLKTQKRLNSIMKLHTLTNYV